MASNTWYTDNSSGYGSSSSSSSSGGFSNEGWMQADSNRGFKNGGYQEHTFNQSGSSSSRSGSSGFAFAQPKKPKTEEEKKRTRNEAVKRHREFKAHVEFLEEKELEDKKNQLRDQEREKSELIGEIRGLSNVFSTIAINNPSYMDEEFHRCRKELFKVANSGGRKS